MAVNLHTCFIAPLLLITPDLINYVMAEVIEQHDELIADLNRQQLEQGIRSDGSPIEPDYTRATVAIKQSKGQPTDKVRLYDTGSFYGSLFVNLFDNAFVLDATDSKAPELTAKYGDKILGLTPANRALLVQIIKPQFIQRLRAAIGL